MIVAVELLTAKCNRLSPSADLQRPGQLIPFFTGMIVTADSISIAARRVFPESVKAFLGFLAGVVDGVIASIYLLVPSADSVGEGALNWFLGGDEMAER